MTRIKIYELLIGQLNFALGANVNPEKLMIDYVDDDEVVELLHKLSETHTLNSLVVEDIDLYSDMVSELTPDEVAHLLYYCYWVKDICILVLDNTSAFPTSYKAVKYWDDYYQESGELNAVQVQTALLWAMTTCPGAGQTREFAKEHKFVRDMAKRSPEMAILYAQHLTFYHNHINFVFDVAEVLPADKVVYFDIKRSEQIDTDDIAERSAEDDDLETSLLAVYDYIKSLRGKSEREIVECLYDRLGCDLANTVVLKIANV